MAISFNYGATAQDVAVNKALKPWKWTTAFRTVSDTGSLARMTDIQSPLDKKTTIKVTLDRIADVYKTLADSVIPVAQQNANASGQTVFVELKTIATKSDGITLLPMVCRIELRLPNDSEITESDVDSLVMATYAGICDATGASSVIAEKMRGALTPAGI